jgi:GNAT superfamily N-acetyltransferase
LSGHLGIPAIRLNRLAPGTRSCESITHALKGFDGFAYTKVSAADVISLGVFLDAGFRVIDTLITFDGHIGNTASTAMDIKVCEANPQDAADVGKIASQSFRYSRFHLDPAISNTTADAIKKDWATGFFSGNRGNRMIVTKSEDNVIGFLQLITQENAETIIDLIAVAPEWQGKRIGHAMVEFANQMWGSLGFVVGTQAANIESQRFYQALGLRTKSSQYVLHRHGFQK